MVARVLECSKKLVSVGLLDRGRCRFVVVNGRFGLAQLSKMSDRYLGYDSATRLSSVHCSTLLTQDDLPRVTEKKCAMNRCGSFGRVVYGSHPNQSLWYASSIPQTYTKILVPQRTHFWVASTNQSKESA